jgi:hypothetical protein
MRFIYIAKGGLTMRLDVVDVVGGGSDLPEAVNLAVRPFDLSSRKGTLSLV